METCSGTSLGKKGRCLHFSIVFFFFASAIIRVYYYHYLKAVFFFFGYDGLFYFYRTHSRTRTHAHTHALESFNLIWFTDSSWKPLRIRSKNRIYSTCLRITQSIFCVRVVYYYYYYHSRATFFIIFMTKASLEIVGKV